MVFRGQSLINNTFLYLRYLLMELANYLKKTDQDKLVLSNRHKLE